MKAFQTSYWWLCVLLGMIVLLGVMQWLWLEQTAKTTRQRLETKLQENAVSFANDFNREMSVAYLLFQISSDDNRKNNWKNFNLRYISWKLQTAYPQLIKDFYVIRTNGEAARYITAAQTFETIATTAELEKIRQIAQDAKLRDISLPIIDSYTLLLPYSAATAATVGSSEEARDSTGFLIIRLDEKVVSQMLADLSRRYFSFSKEDAGNLQVEIIDRASSKVVFINNQNSDLPADELEKDASIAFFDLSGESRTLSNRLSAADFRALVPSLKEGKSNSLAVPSVGQTTKGVSVQVFDNRKNGGNTEARRNGVWLLSISHIDGSLKDFVNHQRNRDFALAFGILLLVGVSVSAIFVAARRTQIFAQRQMDFVSSVSHEFRTPLAVIYSAGENLADGVTSEQLQIAKYGNLIKNEGRKLTQMVEQILEFAGARSGCRKYNFVETNVPEIIENALKECKPLIAEKGFTIEKNIAENLPKIFADKNALSGAVQNLIINSIKYDDGDRYIKVFALKSNGSVNIAVEDSGIGIAKKDLSKVFAPFYRAKTVVDAQIHGSGLGLSLVKQSVEAHGGKVKVESEIGRGSKFIISLPALKD